MVRYLLPLGFVVCLTTLLAIPNTALAEEPKPAILPPPPPPSRIEEELVEKVRKAIDEGVRYLRNQQSKKDGNWEGIVINLLADMEGGVTALVTLALLNCGVKRDDPAIVKALDYLRTLPPKKTYVVGLQAMVFAEARDKQDLPRIQKNAEWLIGQGIGWRVDAQSKIIGGKLEGWSYPGGQLADNSNTQYALLGLYAAKSAGSAHRRQRVEGDSGVLHRKSTLRVGDLGLLGLLQQ